MQLRSLPQTRNETAIYSNNATVEIYSVSDQFHFDTDPYPDPRIRFLE